MSAVEKKRVGRPALHKTRLITSLRDEQLNYIKQLKEEAEREGRTLPRSSLIEQMIDYCMSQQWKGFDVNPANDDSFGDEE